MIITNETPIAALTVGQFKELFLRKEEVETAKVPEEGKRYVRGIAGIARLFQCSTVTAQRYKDTFLRPAVQQRGRIVITDVEKAKALFNERKGSYGK